MEATEGKSEREAREIGGLGVKPPAGSGAEPLYASGGCCVRMPLLLLLVVGYDVCCCDKRY